MTIHDMTGAQPDLPAPVAGVFVSRSSNGVLWLSGLLTDDDVVANATFGDNIVWARIVFACRTKYIAVKVGTFSLN